MKIKSNVNQMCSKALSESDLEAGQLIKLQN